MTCHPPDGWLQRAAISLLALLMTACAQHMVQTPPVTELPPLEIAAATLPPAEALLQTTSPDMLALNDEMRDFVDRYVHGDQRQRLQTLHRSLLSPAMVGVSYDPTADGTAAQVFHSGAANCLSYAHLFVAMARYAGLNARFLSTSLRPEWSRHGNQIALRRHVNVTVKLRSGEQYVVDIDPIARERIASADILSDDEALALYHSNLAMDALLDDDLSRAYSQAVKAVALGSNIDYLWVNLGIVYRQAGQDAAAEAVYHTALTIDPDSRTAMNNLAVLYNSRGDMTQARIWEDRVRERRERNPYYHYYLGELAESRGELDLALAHYRDAIELKQTDAEFYFRVARLHLAMQQRDQSRRYIKLEALDSGSVVTAKLQTD